MSGDRPVADHVNVVVQSGLCAPNGAGINACQYTTGNDAGNSYNLRIAPLGTPLAGTWQQFVVHVHHAADSSGLVQGWWRPRGSSTWTQTVNWSGYPTVQWSSGHRPEASEMTVDKIGAYRGQSNVPISIWLDGFCDATSFSAAASCL